MSVRGAAADVDGAIVLDVELKGLGGQPSLFVDRCITLSADDVQVPKALAVGFTERRRVIDSA